MRKFIAGLVAGLLFGGLAAWAGPTVYRTTIRYHFTEGAQIDKAVGFFGVSPVAQQTALTAKDASTVDATYGTQEANVIANNRTRIEEIELRLKAYGLLP